jgi:hypothetical protein
MKLSINWKMTISIKWISVKRPPVDISLKRIDVLNIMLSTIVSIFYKFLIINYAKKLV